MGPVVGLKGRIRWLKGAGFLILYINRAGCGSCGNRLTAANYKGNLNYASLFGFHNPNRTISEFKP
jgi:hypothetical protein